MAPNIYMLPKGDRHSCPPLLIPMLRPESLPIRFGFSTARLLFRSAGHNRRKKFSVPIDIARYNRAKWVTFFLNAAILGYKSVFQVLVPAVVLLQLHIRHEVRGLFQAVRVSVVIFCFVQNPDTSNYFLLLLLFPIL